MGRPSKRGGKPPDHARYAADCAASRLTKTESAVAFRVLVRSMTTFRFYESAGTIAAHTGYTRKNVQNALAGLVAKGLLQVLRKGGPNGAPTLYKPTLNGSSSPHIVKPGGVASDASGGVASDSRVESPATEGGVASDAQVESPATPKREVKENKTGIRPSASAAGPTPDQEWAERRRLLRVQAAELSDVENATGNGD